MNRLVAALLLTLWSVVAQAELTIEVTQGADRPTPVAVVPFGWGGVAGLPEDVAQVIGSDLSRSGLFVTMNRNDMLSLPDRQEQVNYRDWRVSGQDYLIIGRVEPVENSVKVTYELYDVLKQQQIMTQSLSGTADALRDMAHIIADDIYEELTGFKGAFYTKILYVAVDTTGTGKRRYRLRIADSDGARPRTVLESEEPILSPAWSKDAKRVAYVSFETTRPAIYIQDLQTGQRQRLQTFAGLNSAPAWSPDGNRLALVLSKDGNPEIYVFNLVTRKLSRITNHFSIDTEPSWSPDGRTLIFTSDRGGQPQLYQVDVFTRVVERKTFEGDYNAKGSLTEDGRFLAMVHKGESDQFHIAVQDLKSGRVDVLTQTQLDESPTIAPNGGIILYATIRGDQGVLAGVTLDGSIKFILPATKGDVREPAWSPYLQ